MLKAIMMRISKPGSKFNSIDIIDVEQETMVIIASPDELVKDNKLTKTARLALEVVLMADDKAALDNSSDESEDTKSNKDPKVSNESVAAILAMSMLAKTLDKEKDDD